MKIFELMSTEPRAVRASDGLDAAARALWEQDCGMVPVVDAEGAVVGVVTDRDICMGAYTKGRPLGEIQVGAVMARKVHTCRADESAAAAMQAMTQLQVHRLPVVDGRGALVGVISTNDLVRAVHARPAALEASAVIRALATIGAPRRAASAAGPAAHGKTGALPVVALPSAPKEPGSAPAAAAKPGPSRRAPASRKQAGKPRAPKKPR